MSAFDETAGVCIALLVQGDGQYCIGACRGLPIHSLEDPLHIGGSKAKAPAVLCSESGHNQTVSDCFSGQNVD